MAIADLLSIGALLLILRFHPAPAFSRYSLRKRALLLLTSGNSREPLVRRFRRTRVPGWLRSVLYGVVLLGVIQIPLDIRWGPLGDVMESEEFLQTLWQVVAAALGLSVAMIAFAFEAFQTTGSRAYGGSLREFARQSSLVYLIEFGVLSLLLDGVVLSGVGYNAPRGLPAAWAIFCSALTLALVVFVVHRVLNLLDDRALRKMRAQRVNALAEEAMREQLLGQAATVWLAQNNIGIKQDLLRPPGALSTPGTKTGVLSDVRLGPLARFSVRHPKFQLSVAANLNDTIGPNTSLVYSQHAVTSRLTRAFRIKQPSEEVGSEALNAALARLHQQAMDAARAGNELEWRAIADSYEQVLLALPRAAAGWGVPFSGAVMAPGLLGYGPVQRIAGFLYDELVAAVDSNSRELIGPITYFPQMIAVSASQLGAPALAKSMLGLYPQMYALARRRSP